ncbi:MAG: indolepyruvate oxidoreductase subunit beta [Treponema sp.]|jgi:indolepyruvate ferredoxin oxidoreductase beta subunit|nr:indolepyruvate oxidoreductase subunit beta [Treponema sp.]
MKKDIILAGVGGQGVLSVAAVIAKAAVKSGFFVRQSEVHGMAQRGGAVLSHLRIADMAIASDLVPKGCADLIVSMEPLESLRYADFLSPDGALLTTDAPFVNIPDYPDSALVLKNIECFPIHGIINAVALSKSAGLPKAVNVVMVGAASLFLPISIEDMEATIEETFAAKGQGVIDANKRAFRLGREETLNIRHT